MIFQKFLAVVSYIDNETIQEYQDTIKNVCKSKFNDPELIRFLADDPPGELIRGLSQIAYLLPTKTFKNSSKYIEPLYGCFTRANGNDRRLISVIFFAIKKVTEVDVTTCSFVSKQHVRVIRTLMSELECL